MKRLIASLLTITMFLCGCGKRITNESGDTQTDITVTSGIGKEEGYLDKSSSEIVDDLTQNLPTQEPVNETKSIQVVSGSEYAKTLSFDGLEDENLQRYVKDNIYSELLTQINNDEYAVVNVDTVYISKEYIEELDYNSKANVYFGYTLAELEDQFQGQKYVFTLGENGETVVVPFEGYDDVFNKVLKNVAIGAGVILICVTVSAVTAGAGAPAISMIFAASAKTATTMAVSSGMISGLAAGVIEGVKTGDMDKALKAGALAGSEGFMWGAITGAVAGGAGEAIALKGATANGLTMNEVAMIQKESGYPLDVIKGFKTMDQYNICKNAGLKPTMVNGKMHLLRDVDWDLVDDKGLTNLQRIAKGKPPIDSTGQVYELHHIGQNTDSTLAMLTEAEHRSKGIDTIWHDKTVKSTVHDPSSEYKWETVKTEFWKAVYEMVK